MKDLEKQDEQIRLRTADDVFAIGMLIDGRFRIEELRGQGANGAVYRAENIANGETVAIKVLSRNLLTEERDVERFFREAKVTSGLQHEGIVSVKAFGKTSNDDIYMVMGFVNGKTLAELIKEQKSLKLDDFVPVMMQVLNALAYAHERNIVHRDIKPSNIMVEAYGSSAVRAKILDFGLAQLHEGADSQSLTQTGSLLGTPAYMSPEQCRGDRAVTASDIYACGCVLYEALTGHPPFTATSALETMSMHLNEPLNLAKERPLSPKMREVLAHALAKDPYERYANAREMANCLRDATSDKANVAIKPNGLPKLAVVSSVVLALVAVVGISAAVLVNQNSSHKQTAAQTDVSNSIAILQKAEDPRTPPAERIKCYNRVVELEAPKLPKERRVRGLDIDSLNRLSRAHFGLALLDSDAGWRQGHVKLCLYLADNWGQFLDKPSTGDIYRLAIESTGVRSLQEDYADRAVDFAKDDPIRLQTAINFGLMFLQFGDFEEAEALFYKASDLHLEFANPRQEADYNALRMSVILQKNNLSIYREKEKATLNQFKTLPQTERVHAADLCNLLAQVCITDYPKFGEEWIAHGFEMLDQAPAGQAKNAGSQNLNLTQCKYAEQQRKYKELLAAAEKGLETPPSSYSLFFELTAYKAEALIQLNKYSEAEPVLIRALNIAQRANNHQWQFDTLQKLALVMKHQQKWMQLDQCAGQLVNFGMKEPNSFGRYITASRELQKFAESKLSKNK